MTPPIDIDAPAAVLGGLTPAQFMRRYWQKKPLRVRHSGLQAPLTRSELFRLAARDDVESRLVRCTARGRRPAWSLQTGPFAWRSLPPLKQPDWTLLVQGVDLQVPAAHAMLAPFRFVPQARLDDLMVSWASPGGGVGPHFDSYDVFLVQVQGRRRWRIGPLRGEPVLREDLPLKILADFRPTEEHVLEPGDLLYLPPRWAHDGEALDTCMTCSVGFRAPTQGELLREVLARLVDGQPARSTLYRDPGQPATATPAAVPAGLVAFAGATVAAALRQPHALEQALGEYLSEPKPQVWFEAGAPLPADAGVRLDARSCMLYDQRFVFLNGESWRCGGRDAALLRRLADRRELPAAALRQASADLRTTLSQWAEQGWLSVGPD